MFNSLRWLVLVALTMLCAGCGDKPLTEDELRTRSFVFGYVDYEEGPGDLESLTLQQVVAGAEPHYWGCTIVDESIFYGAYLPRGKYQVQSLYSHSFFRGNFVLRFPTYERNETAFEISEPGIIFLGSFRIVKHKAGVFKREYELVPQATPTASELLRKILKENRREDEIIYWRSRLEAYLQARGEPARGAGT